VRQQKSVQKPEQSLLLVSRGTGASSELLSLGAAVLVLVAKSAARAVADVALSLSADDEGRHVDELLADSDVALEDKNTGVVDGAGELVLEDDGLETTLKEVLGLEGKDIIELVLVLGQNTETVETAEHCTTLEHTALVIAVKSEKETCTLAELGQSVVHTVNLTLATETVDTAETELTVETLRLVGALGSTEGG